MADYRDIMDFLPLVEEMRTNQKKWFNAHDYAALQRSKTLERQVDKQLWQFLHPGTPTDGQFELFNS